MKHKVAHRVHAEEIHQGVSVEHISLGLAHLAVPLEQPGMSEHLLGQGKSQSHEEDGPVNGVEADDVLSNQVKIRRPEFLKLLRALPVAVVADARDIVGQGVQPHIGHVLGIKGHRNAPGKGGPGHAQILEAGKKEIVHHLILPGDRLDKLRMLVDVLNELRRVLAHAEEVGLLLSRLHLPAAVRALAVHQLGLREEGLAGRAVEALIVALIDVALVIEFLKNLLHLGLMVLVCGADELVVGGVHQIPDALNLSGDLIHKSLGAHPCGLGLLLDLLAVLVRTRLEKYIISLGPLVPGNAVRENDLIGVADVGFPGGVGDGRRNIVWFLTVLTHMIIPLFVCRVML